MPVVRRWTNYFSLSHPRSVYELGGWLLTRLRACFTKHRWAGKWQKEWPIGRLYELGVATPSRLLQMRAP